MFDGIFINKFLFTLALTQESSSVDFNIAASVSNDASPNVLSELIFDPIDTTNAYANLGYMWLVGSKTAIGITGTYSESISSDGRALDYDFDADDRTDMFSLSRSSLDDSQIRHYAVETFSKTRWFDKPGHYLTGGIGFEKKIYHLHITDGQQKHPVVQPISGLKSTYEPEFKNTYLFIATEHKFRGGYLTIKAQHIWSHLDSKADWNLREEFAHPVSYIHDGDGTGHTLSIKYSYPIHDNIDIYTQLSSRKVEIKNGYDQIYFADGKSAVTKLNQVNEKTNAFSIGATFHF